MTSETQAMPTGWNPEVVEAIPADYEVKVLRCSSTDPNNHQGDTCPIHENSDVATDGYCGLSWDDSVVTSMTPAPSARCPFEPFHVYPDEGDE